MARVTVEDCITKIPNRFELVMKAAQRSRNISAGAATTVERDKDKNPVVALREIADATTDIGELEEQLVKGLQHFVESDEPVEDEMDAASMQDEIAAEGGDAIIEEEIREDVLTIETEAQEFSMSIGESDGNDDADDNNDADDRDSHDTAPFSAFGENVETEVETAPAPETPDESAFSGTRFEDVAPENEASPDAPDALGGDTPEGT